MGNPGASAPAKRDEVTVGRSPAWGPIGTVSVLVWCFISPVAWAEDAPPATPPAEHVPAEALPRRIPDQAPHPFPDYIYESIPQINDSASDFIPIPDRWRMFYAGKYYDPYNQNELKADIPIAGDPGEEWFTEVSMVSDTLFETRRIPVPVGQASTKNPNSNNVFGDGDQNFFAENIIASFSIIKGDTAFKPPDFELRITPIFQVNRLYAQENGALNADPAFGDTRTASDIGFQELFVDVHLANLSDQYDFVSSRIGVQQFNADFRGFLFDDSEPGVRIFGNYDNNKTQFNAAAFFLLDKYTNTGINTTFDSRHQNVYVANLYRQDMLVKGHTMLFSVVNRYDNAGDYGYLYDQNNFLVRPAPIGDERFKNLNSTYFGIGGDGHIGRVNTTTQFYYVTGYESHNQIANQQVQINAAMFAQECSYDVDWIRFRGSFFWASGDDDPYDGVGTGFDAIFDNPNFAGGDLSFFQRETIPFVGGGGVNLTNRNSLLPDLKAGKELGQANFVNPGIRVYNVGVDFELLPELKLITNTSFLQFDQVAVLQSLRQDGSISNNIGTDLSAGFLWRPFFNNNVLIRTGVGVLFPGSGQKNLFGDQVLYDAFTNLILQY